jgi:CIC family chloride channel protein
MLSKAFKELSQFAARIRTSVRSNEFFLVPIAIIIGCFAGFAVAFISWTAQIAHVIIYGIPLDVRLSAHTAVNPVAALIAPALGGLILGWMEWSRRRWNIPNAADPVEANFITAAALRFCGRIAMADKISGS